MRATTKRCIKPAEMKRAYNSEKDVPVAFPQGTGGNNMSTYENKSDVTYESLPPFTSERPCPYCHELLHWSEYEAPPNVDFDTRTGEVLSVELARYCLNCGYRETGLVHVNKGPVWTEGPGMD
jgi:hypothetical protein